jgi:hypothetical protein
MILLVSYFLLSYLSLITVHFGLILMFIAMRHNVPALKAVWELEPLFCHEERNAI